jgi:hypothetical protein
MDRYESRSEAGGDAPAQDEHHRYEPPALTALGSFAELTRITKSGPQADPGDGFQPSQV